MKDFSIIGLNCKMKSILVVFIGYIVLPSALAGHSLKIIGGQDAKPHEFPFMVSIYYNRVGYGSKNICGGVIISELFILTAAHCIFDTNIVPYLLIKAGKHNISAIEQSEEIRFLAKAIPHEDYVFKDVRTPDIGLIKLDKPLDFTRAIKPIALSKKKEITRGRGIIVGWGWTSFKRHQKPDILQKVNVPILPNEVCAKVYERIMVNRSDMFLCTGPFPGKISACRGDSGGPLVRVERGSRTVIGITNFVYVDCNPKLGPTVFTRISTYIDWIIKNMK